MSPRGVKALSLDGGGIRGIAVLIILLEIMRRIQHDEGLEEEPKPCDYFDLIGGTSTGGLIAILLGRLRLSVQEAIDIYGELSEKIFGEKKLLGKDGTFKASNLEKAVKEILKSKGFKEDERMLDEQPNACKTFVCATPAHNASSPRLLRTYSVRENQSYNCTIWEAARATSAAPTFFKRIAIGEKSMKEEFIDGGLGCNNPIHQVAVEAERVFGTERPIACLVSIGTGHSSTIGLPTPDKFQRLLPTDLIKVLRQIATDCESKAEEYEQRYDATPNVYYRFSVEQGMQNISLAEWRKLGETIQHTKQYLERTAVNSKLNNVVKVLMGKSVGVALPVHNSAVKNIAPKLVPVPTSVFTGREDVLNQMDKYFNLLRSSDQSPLQRVFVLFGLGGAGKTQIALKFAETAKKRFTQRYWIDAASTETLEEDLSSIADKDDPSFDKTLQYLSLLEEDWLLLFDNADDPEIDLRRFFPRCLHGNIIITTRNPQLCIHAPQSNYEVGRMQTEESVSLLLALSGATHSDVSIRDATLITQLLGDLALAITQAGCYIREQRCTLTDYVRFYDSRRSEILKTRPKQTLDGYEWTVYTTWEMSFEKLPPVAQRLLQVFSFLHYDNIFKSIFERASNFLAYEKEDIWGDAKDFLTKLVPSGSWDDFLFQEHITILTSYSLISISRPGVYSIHPLVHSWCRDSLKVAETAHTRAMQILALSITFNDSHEFIFRRNLVAHLDACLSKKTNLNASLVLKFVHVYCDIHRFKDAEVLALHGLQLCKDSGGDDHPQTLAMTQNLIATYHGQYKLQGAEEVLVPLIEKRTSVLGEDHPDTLNSRHSLGVVYSNWEKLREAEEVLVPLIEKRTSVLGEDHPDTLRSRYELGVVYSKQKKLRGAEEVLVPLIEKRTSVLGEDHPDTLRSRHDLGVVYSKQEKLREAEEVLVPLIEKRTSLLGEDHPDTLNSRHSLGVVYSDWEKLQEAEEVLVPLIQKRTLVLGEDHPNTLRSRHSLGVVYSKQVKLREAEGLLVPLIEKQTSVLGEDHPDTLNSRHELGVVYSQQNKLREAEEVLVLLIEKWTLVLGEDHPNTLTCMAWLAFLYKQMERWEEAESLLMDLVAKQSVVLGSEHPHTLLSIGHLDEIRQP